MPRGKPNQIIEHRISLSNYERTEMQKLFRSHRISKNIDSAIDGAKIAGVGFAAYFIYKGIVSGAGLLSSAWMSISEKTVEEVEDVLAGVGNFVVNPVVQLKDRFLVDLGLGPANMNTHWKYDLRYLTPQEFQRAYGMSKPDFGYRMSQETTAENRQAWVNAIREAAQT